MIDYMSRRQKLYNEFKESDASSHDPALAVGTAGTGLVAALYVIIHFAFPKLPDEVLTAILTALSILLPIIISWIIRSKVWSPASVSALVAEAIKRHDEAKIAKPVNKNDPPTLLGK